jgi:3',5'-cyclic-AMP phosphodiesterase
LPIRTFLAVFCAVSAWFLFGASDRRDFSFVLLGDRTGEAQPGVYEQVWQETSAEKPEFVLTAGDTIQGGNDATAEEEWRQVKKIWLPYRAIPLYLTPGNHDIWSPQSETLFQRSSGHPAHYSFDVRQIHVTILDNSRSDELSEAEITFLKQDLQAHSGQPVKIIISHRPSWLLPVLFGNTNTPIHRIAKQYGVKYIIAGHLHQMLHFELDGITYLSLPSAGGHLRGSKRYEDGWFFAHTLVSAENNTLQFQIKELHEPYGRGRVSVPPDWGAAGLKQAAQHAAPLQ